MPKSLSDSKPFAGEQGLYFSSFEFSPLPALITDKGLAILHANFQARALFGVDFDEVKGRRMRNRLTQFIARDSLRLYEWLAEKKEPYLDIVLQTRDAHTKIALYHEQLSFEGNDVHHFVLQPSNVPSDTELNLYRKVYQGSGQPIYITDSHDNIIASSLGLSELCGYRKKDLVGKPAELLYTDENHGNLSQLRDEMSKERQHWKVDTEIKSRDGKTIRCNVHVSVIEGEISGESDAIFVHMLEDVSSQLKLEQELKAAARVDTLTKLANREGFNAQYREMFNEAQRNGEQLTLFFIDLDNFKLINDQHGHDHGDKVLQQASKRLRESIGNKCFIARLGGDEFTVLLAGGLKQVTLGNIAKKIIDQLSTPFDVMGATHRSGASVGIAQYPEDGITRESLLVAADNAMYIAKRSGKNTYAFFDRDLEAKSSAAKIVRKQVSLALNDRRIKPFYQSIHDMRSGEIVGFEALARLIDGNEIFLPGHFLEEIARDSLAIQLGKRILNDVIHDINSMKAFGIQAPVSVNLSSYQLRSQEIIRSLEKAVERTPEIAGKIKIEITETMIFENDETVRENVERLMHCGYAIILDDFGTGHSSIYTLKQYDFSAIKIDQNFIQDIGNNEKNSNLLSGIISLVNSLEVNLICEGVEREDQQQYLLEAGCVFGQGHLYSKPTDLKSLLNSNFYQ